MKAKFTRACKFLWAGLIKTVEPKIKSFHLKVASAVVGKRIEI